MLTKEQLLDLEVPPKLGDITLELLQKSKEDRELPKIEKRLTHFYLIPKLMEECSIVKFCNKKGKQGFCQLRSDFILYNERLGVKLHLGVIDEKGTEYYVPETFIVSTLRGRDKNRVTEEQVFMNVIDIDIAPLL